MGNHLVKDRVQRFNAEIGRWELFDVIEQAVVARHTHQWPKVRLEGSIPRKMPARRVHA